MAPDHQPEPVDVPCPACDADPCCCPPISPEQMADLCRGLTGAERLELERLRAERGRPPNAALH